MPEKFKKNTSSRKDNDKRHEITEKNGWATEKRKGIRRFRIVVRVAAVRSGRARLLRAAGGAA